MYNFNKDELAALGGQVIDPTPMLLDPMKEWEPLQYTFTRDGVGFAPLGDIQAIKAPQKNGKTFLITLLLGAALKGEYMGIKCEINKPKVLLFDTEQHPRNTQLVYRRFCAIAGISGHAWHDNIRVYHTRGAMPQVVHHIVLQEVMDFHPDIVIIDGLVDLVVDPNDQMESKAIVTELSGLAMDYNCSIWNVLHVNPGSDKMRGHLGTILAQKSSDVLMVKKDKRPDGAIFGVEQSDARDKDIAKFDFVIENRPAEDGNYIALPVAPYVSDKELEELDQLMSDILVGHPMTRKDLVAAIMDKCSYKERKAYDIVKKAHENEIIFLDTVRPIFTYFGLRKQRKNEF